MCVSYGEMMVIRMVGNAYLESGVMHRIFEASCICFSWTLRLVGTAYATERHGYMFS